jgi:hypothetical protein
MTFVFLSFIHFRGNQTEREEKSGERGYRRARGQRRRGGDWGGRRGI